MTILKTCTADLTPNATSSSSKNPECKARICDPDRDVTAATTRQEDQSGSIYLLGKFMLDRDLYDEAIRQYKVRRFLLLPGYNYTALELCGQGPAGYFSGLAWEQIAQVCLQNYARNGGHELKEFFCPDCEGFHGFHIV